MDKRPGGALSNKVSADNLTRSRLFPFLSINFQQLSAKSFLGPAMVTLVFVLLLFAATETTGLRLDPFFFSLNPPVFTSRFLVLIVVYLTLASFYFVVRVAGKPKPWLLLLGSAAFTVFFVQTPIFEALLKARGAFEHAFAGEGLLTTFFREFVAAGLLEEFVKALPVLLVFLIGLRLNSPYKERVALSEPLDGILIGAASAAGFAAFETVSNFSVKFIEIVNKAYGDKISLEQMQTAWGQIGNTFLATSIPRSLAEAFGHIAYSGYLGYFAGLAVISPRRKVRILLTGYLTAACLHGLWDTIPDNDLGLPRFIVGAVAYVFLAAAILKARQISPNQDLLRQSILIKKPPVSASFLEIGSAKLPLTLHLKLSESQLPGLKASGPDGTVGEVTAHPRNQDLLGLKNLSRTVWRVTDPTHDVRTFGSGQSFALLPGTRVDFGTVQGLITSGNPVDPSPTPSPAVAAPPASPPNMPSSVRAAQLSPSPLALVTPFLQIGGKTFALSAGTKLDEAQIPGLKAHGTPGIVAEIAQHPRQPAVLGMKNLSSEAWTVMDPNRDLREISSGQSFAIVPGTKIDFGSTSGEIR
jgi:RsiW-degrading membrane proteinase PrsW (M82 family)